MSFLLKQIFYPCPPLNFQASAATTYKPKMWTIPSWIFFYSFCGAYHSIAMNSGFRISVPFQKKIQMWETNKLQQEEERFVEFTLFFTCDIILE